LIWPNVSDLRGWKNNAFETYDIKSIPAQMLIDPDGIIIGIWGSETSELKQFIQSTFSWNKNI
jgi:hypothetical protein